MAGFVRRSKGIIYGRSCSYDQNLAAGGVLSKLFETYTPRRQCMNYEQDVIWLHFVSDLLIALAYFSILIVLVYFARRRKDLAYNWMVLLFAVFIVLCGTTHLFNVGFFLQLPFYRLDGAVKLVTVGGCCRLFVPCLGCSRRKPSPCRPPRNSCGASTNWNGA